MEVEKLKATLITKRGGEEHYTRYAIEEVVEMIRTGKLRNGRQIEDAKPRPSVCFSVQLRTMQDKKVATVYNELILLEINNLPDKKTAEEVRNEVKAIPYTQITFIGADGRSVKIVCRAVENNLWQRPQGYDESEVIRFHLNAYAKLHYLYSTQLALRVDNIPPAIYNSCLMSHDPDIFYDPDSVWMSASSSQQTAERVSRIRPTNDSDVQQNPNLIPGLSTEASMRHEYQACKTNALEACRLDEGEDFVCHVLEVLAQNCQESGIEEAFAVRMTLYDGRLNKDPEYVQTVFDSQYDKKLKATWPLKHVKPSQLLTYKTEAFLNSRYELRKNVMTGVPQYREKDSFEYKFRDLTKEVMNTMSIRALKAGLDSWDKDIKRYIESTMIPEFDPLNEWLDNLPAWDGLDRITALANRIKTANKFWQSDFHTWMLSMVAHWEGKDRNHGNAIVPLLIGKQGCGKSTFCGILLPEELREYYNDKIDFKNDTAINLGLTSFALINIDEFDALSKSQQPLLKHLISKSDVKMRPPYGKAYEQRRRYASFIGTTNNTRPLPDDRTGARRFICIVVDGMIDTLTPIDYEQVYAQLKAEIDQGMRYWFDEDDNKRIIEENRKFERVGSLEKMIDQVFKPMDDLDTGTPLTIKQVIDILYKKFPNFQRTKNIHAEIGRALNALGYRAKKTKNYQLYCIEKR